MAARTLRVVIAGDDRGFNRTMGRAKKLLAGFAVGFAAKKAFDFFKDATLSAEAYASQQANTAQIIKQTGGAANVTQEQVAELTKQLQRQTGVDDKLIQAGSNVLLTFKDIRNEAGKGNDVFDRANGIMLDLANVTGQDVTGAATMLGKALNDPIRGLTSMRRVGVSFTEQQEEQIKALAASGDVMGAQKLMLKELESQYGGTAEASADSSQKLAQSFEDIKERIGAVLLPWLDKAAAFVVDEFMPAFDRFAEDTGPKIGRALATFGAVAMDVFRAVRDAVRFVADIWDKVFGRGGSMPKATDENRKIIAETWRKISEVVAAAVEFVRAIVDVKIKIIRALWDRWGKDLIDFARRNWKSIKQVIGGALDIIAGIFKAVTALLKGDWKGFGDALKQIAKGAWDVVRGVISGAFAAIETMFELGLAAMDALWDTTWNAIRTATKAAWRNIKQAIRDGLRAAWQMVKDWGKTLIEWFTNLPGKLVEALSGMGGKLKDAFEGALSKIKLSLPFSFNAQGDGPGRGGGGPALARSRSLAAGLPISISSTYRSPAHNARVGGSPTSYHLDRGNPAVDWVGPTWALDAFAARLRAAGGWRELLWRVPNHAPGDNPHVHVAHSGGRVDSSWPTLPGLAADERPAILQTGETVLPRGGAGINVQVFIDGQEIRRALKIDRQSARAA